MTTIDKPAVWHVIECKYGEWRSLFHSTEIDDVQEFYDRWYDANGDDFTYETRITEECNLGMYGIKE